MEFYNPYPKQSSGGSITGFLNSFRFYCGFLIGKGKIPSLSIGVSCELFLTFKESWAKLSRCLLKNWILSISLRL